MGFCCIQKPTVGNILESSFEDVWNGAVAKDVRAVTERGKLHESCDTGFCPYAYQQRAAAKGNKLEYPRFIDLDLPNTHCNIGGTEPSPESPACVMCPRSAIDFRPEEDRLDAICDEIKPYLIHVKKLHIQGIAEPFWKRKVFEVLDRLEFEKHHNRILFSTFTNATIFNKKIVSEYTRRCPKSYTYISLDAATAETYEKIRRVKAFNTVVENTIEFGINRKPNQFLICANNINTFNVGEVTGMIDIAVKARADWVEFNSTDPCDHTMVEFTVNQKNRELFAEAESKIQKHAAKTGMAVRFIKPLTRGIKPKLVQLKIL